MIRRLKSEAGILGASLAIGAVVFGGAVFGSFAVIGHYATNPTPWMCQHLGLAAIDYPGCVQ